MTMYANSTELCYASTNECVLVFPHILLYSLANFLENHSSLYAVELVIIKLKIILVVSIAALSRSCKSSLTSCAQLLTIVPTFKSMNLSLSIIFLDVCSSSASRTSVHSVSKLKVAYPRCLTNGVAMNTPILAIDDSISNFL